MFEWDAAKGRTNLRKHGVSFEEAAPVFLDPQALDGADIRHSGVELRRLRIGRSAANRVLTVAYTERRRADAEDIRIISARQASRKEREAYRRAP